jgi:hypothetical protein
MTANTKAKLIVFLNALTLIGGAITIILLFRIIGNAAQQNTSTNTKIAASQEVTEKELRCLASFFSQPNRQSIRISNLKTCEIIHTDTGQTEVLPLSPTPVKIQSSPAVPSSDTNKNSTSTPTPTQVNTPQTTTSTNLAPSQTAPQVPSRPTTPDPKRILGIPLCVPFTGACIR